MSRVTAPARRGAISTPAAAAAPNESAARRLNGKVCTRFSLAVGNIGTGRRSTTKDLARIEVDIQLLPQIIGGLRQHVVRLRLQHGAHRAVAGRLEQRSVAAGQHLRLADEAMV